MHIPTLREDPADADAASHRLLVRAGFIRQLMAGHYSLLPLAVRVRMRIIEIIREEMNRIGAQEFALPAMHPADIWRRTGRWDLMGDEMFRLRDRRGADIALGMTHEEIFTTLALELNSYRELPQMWYQFQTKFRDEPRPKAGLMRTREFTMKDSYSFDLGHDGLDRSFDLHHQAYVRIFARLGIPAVPVEASSGSMGGSASTEFMCPSPAGEDLVVHCPACGYAANMEKASAALGEVADGDEGPSAPQAFPTPGVRTIDDLAVEHGQPADRQIKTLVYVIDGKLTLVLLRGDHALVEQKLSDALGANAIRPAHADEIQGALGASPGSLGAVGVTHLTVVADIAIRGRRNMVTGANIDGMHLSGVSVDRDLAVAQWADMREVAGGEPCISCGNALEVMRTIEVGHIFKLGYKYSDALNASVLEADGSQAKIIMGSYGIGVERAIAAIVENHHDGQGIVWPLAVAPFHVAVTVAQQSDQAVANAAEQIYRQLAEAGVEVIIDDREERAGVKFRDVELVGIPIRVTVGARTLKQGLIELTERATGATSNVPIAEVIERVRKTIDTISLTNALS
jgi:prolyl-tRNA synthetase